MGVFIRSNVLRDFSFMSLTRRLRRIVRAHLGSLRDDPVERRADPSGRETASSAGPDPSAEPDSSAAPDPSGSPDVPPEVAKAYRALEVPVGSDRETVKTAYRDLMKKYHQDRFQQDEEKREMAGTVSKRLNKAHDRILEYLDTTS